MSIVPQPSLFSWKDVETSPEIVRLAWVLDSLPDEALLRALGRPRRGKRDDYPIVGLWRSVVAGVVLGHATIAALIRELRRNTELRQVCGFDPLWGERAVPPKWVFSRFFARLFEHEALVHAIFDELLRRVGVLLPDLARAQAVDSKALPVVGGKPLDADVGTKTYQGVDAHGKTYEKVQQWFGYKLHLIVDARYELPLAWEVTAASVGDSPRLMPMVETFARSHPDLAARAETLAADRAYDDGADKADLYDHYGISPVIPPRDCWSHTGGPRQRPLHERRSDTIYLGPTGQVLCKIAPFAQEEEKAFAPMQFQGFEAARRTLKFRCPAAAYGVQCKNRAACRCRPSVREGKYGRVVRVPLSRDRRLLTPLYAHSRTFAQAYRRRTAIERVNARLDHVYGLERAFVRSRRKMTLRVALALSVMLATAAAWIAAGKQENLRCLLRAA